MESVVMTLSVAHITRKLHSRFSPIFRMLPMAQSFSNGVDAITSSYHGASG